MRDEPDEQSPDFGQREPDQFSSPFPVAEPLFGAGHGQEALGEHGEGVMCRYQPVYWRTWWWSSPVSPLEVWKVSSIARQALAIGQRDPVGAVADVIGQFWRRKHQYRARYGPYKARGHIP